MPNFYLKRFLSLVLSMLGVACCALAATLPPVVGEAVMVIGVANISPAEGVGRPIARGDAVREGDRIETDAGGHVHLRFVDGARVSVRPFSRLQVENYSHSQQQPDSGAIRFRLDHGVVRSVTGAWGELARERFRLNTPLAAIGIKGTDFIASTDADKTLASVFTGAIILAPLTASCAGSLGPCLGTSDTLLSASMRGQMIAFYRSDTTPRVVALAESMSASRMLPANEPGAAQTSKVVSADSVQSNNSVSSLSDKGVSKEILAAAVSYNQVKDTPSSPAVEPAAPAVSQLQWGRMPWAPALPSDTLSVALARATASGLHATVGNGGVNLYRDNPVGAQFVATEASAQFRRAGGSAFLSAEEGRKIESVAVSGGVLSVDFARATFDTRVTISSPRLGTDSVTSNGQVRSNGFLLGQGGNAYVVGALSLDGKEAGYSFDKALPAGNVSGITLWGR